MMENSPRRRKIRINLPPGVDPEIVAAQLREAGRTARSKAEVRSELPVTQDEIVGYLRVLRPDCVGFAYDPNMQTQGGILLRTKWPYIGVVTAIGTFTFAMRQSWWWRNWLRRPWALTFTQAGNQWLAVRFGGRETGPEAKLTFPPNRLNFEELQPHIRYVFDVAELWLLLTRQVPFQEAGDIDIEIVSGEEE